MSDNPPEVPHHAHSRSTSHFIEKLGDGNNSSDQVGNVPSHMLTSVDKQRSSLLSQEAIEQTNQPYSFKTFQQKYDKEIEALRRELLKRKSENKRLHSLIQAAHGSSEISDTEISSRFGTLKYRIQQFTRGHFGDFKNISDNHGFTMMNDKDQVLLLESEIASQLNRDLFLVGLFGLDGDIEVCLRQLERRLADRKVPRAVVVSWRAETVKISKVLTSPEGRTKAIQDLATELCRNLEPYVEINDHTAALIDMVALYEFAYDLALTIRESKTEFQWRQLEHQAPIVATDFDVFPNYHQRDGQDGYVQHKILFGSIHKLIDQGSVLIRKGELLVPNLRLE